MFSKSHRAQSKDDFETWKESKVSNTLNTFDQGDVRTNEIVVYGISAYDSNAMKSPNPHSGIYKADTTRTLDINGGNPACQQGGMIVIEGGLHFMEAYQHHGWRDSEKAGTLTAAQNDHVRGDTPLVIEGGVHPKVTGPLMANSHPGSYTGQDAYNDMLVVMPQGTDRWTI